MDFSKSYQEIKEEIISVRRHIHQNPELAFEEYATSDEICAFLDKYSIKYKRGIAKTGVLARIGSGGKTLMLRADMDALPIEEKTGLEFASKNIGVMHACGHDIHIAAALSAAYVLKKYEQNLGGTVMIVFQPAEETTGGALPMINEGIMQNPVPDAVIGGHTTPALRTGKIWIKSGALMASPDDFCVTFIGKSTHGAEPQNGINPIIPAAEFIGKLSEFVRLSLEENENYVLSVCGFDGGNSINIIPDSASITGTFRSFSEQTRTAAYEAIKRLAEKTAEKHGARIKYTYNFLYPPVINDKSVTDMLTKAAEKTIGKNNIIMLEKPLMTGEDFSYYGKFAPASFMWYGCGLSENEPPLHSSCFTADENAIKTAAEIFCRFAKDFFNTKEI